MSQSQAHHLPNNKALIKHPAPLRLPASFFSYIFHPIFIPLYVTWYIVFINQGFFVGINVQEKKWVFMRVLLNMVFFPLITVILLRGVGFIQSIFLRTQKDRIIPYMASGIFFFWMYLVFHNQPEIPVILTSFTFGVFLASSLALIANIYLKISMHAIGCGGMIGVMLVILSNSPSAPYTLPLMLAVLISGVVCTSRMIVSDHTQKEIYFGFACGLLSQFISAAFVI